MLAAPTEGYALALLVFDGEHHAVEESVAHTPIGADDGDIGLNHLVGLEALRRQMAHERALAGRETEHPGFRDIAAKTTLRKVGARGAGLRAFAAHELHMEELRSLRAHGAQPCFCALPHTRSAFRLVIGNVDMGALCQVAHRFGKRQVLGFHDEGEHVAAFPAAEAMPQLQGGVYLARRGFLVMERAAQPEIATALLDRTRLAHDGHQVAGLADLLDILIADRHGCDRTPALLPCA